MRRGKGFTPLEIKISKGANKRFPERHGETDARQQLSNGVYINRAFGGNRHYRSADGDIVAVTKSCQRTGQACRLS